MWESRKWVGLVPYDNLLYIFLYHGLQFYSGILPYDYWPIHVLKLPCLTLSKLKGERIDLFACKGCKGCVIHLGHRTTMVPSLTPDHQVFN